MSDQASAERGILYFAKGDSFIKEAAISARRVKSVMPGCPITLVADKMVSDDCFNQILLDKDPFLKRDKPKAMQRTPYERTLYLDTDIYLEKAVWELFDILDDFDIAARPDRDLAHIPTDGDTPVEGVPPGVPEYNGGVISYRSTPPVMDLLRDWEFRCRPDHGWDQRSFRPALYHSDARICPIENRYNCKYHHDNTVDGEIKIFHGPLVDRERKDIDLSVARERLNATDEFRIHREYHGALLVNPPLPISIKVPVLTRHLYKLYKERGIKETISIMRDFVSRKVG